MAPKGYGPHKTIYNWFVRWSRLGVFNRIFAELAGRAGEPDRIMIDATQIVWDGDEHCVCELIGRLGVTQSRMSRHMRD